eukprot:3871979-Pleurochrysis_carterae.AAC.3
MIRLALPATSLRRYCANQVFGATEHLVRSPLYFITTLSDENVETANLKNHNQRNEVMLALEVSCPRKMTALCAYA